MRLSKFLSVTALITSFSLLYVWQQTEIFRLAYLSQKKETVAQNLLDKNTVLRYNLKRDSSLISICNKVPEAADFQIPDTYQLVRTGYAGEILEAKGFLSNRENIISLLFGIKRQAEAKTVKSPTTLRADGN